MRNYLVIGGSSGIGAAIVKELKSSENQVYATYKSNQIGGNKNGVAYYLLDVMSEIYDLSFLPDHLDGLVYCPGSINLMPFARIKPEDYLIDYQLNVGGAIKVLQATLPLLRKSDQASVLFFSTVAVKMGFNFHSQVAASKGAIEGLTRSLAAEFAPKIRVNAIAPSITDTSLAQRFLNTDEKIKSNAERHPMKQIGQAEDIAGMAAYLLSDQAKWITGQVFAVDGGMSAVKV